MTHTLAWATATDVGRVREQNEDSLVAADGLFAVADGMGGRRAGEVASALAVQVLAERAGEQRTAAQLVAAVAAANQAVVEAGAASGERQGMATTLTGLALVSAEQWVVFNIGDSRVYRWAEQRFEQLTIDHSAVQEMVSAGFLDSAAARTHPRRNVVTRALGSLPAPETDVWPLAVRRGDRFLACSDGLTNELTDTEIAAVLRADAAPQAAADALVARALAAGGSDNVTVIVVDVRD
ncbi:MAG: protein phosphatase [Frankiales bacterium]|nr:protein phosphatase [Frankiales bacterium]